MNSYFIIAGILNFSIATLHIGIIFVGAPWYRLFGAGEQMARLAEQGSLKPTLITSGIVIVFFIWSLYAFSAAKLIFPLPYMRLVLIGITTIYLVRGVAGFFLMNNPLGRSPSFWFWSSVICMSFGIVHLIGLRQQWSSLSP